LPFFRIPSNPGSVLGLLALAAIAFVIVTSPAGAAGHADRLVIRGDATAVDGPCGPSACLLELTDGHFRGTLGTGAYTGSIKLKVANTFPNGEGGICAPIKGHITLGAGSADRLVFAVSGDSCQDGGGPLDAASFIAVARFKVKYGTGRYARATGSGHTSFSEDAARHHRMTLVGRITR
jgi:hypothetical protein